MEKFVRKNLILMTIIIINIIVIIIILIIKLAMLSVHTAYHGIKIKYSYYQISM